MCIGIENFQLACTYVLMQVRLLFSLMIRKDRDMGACRDSDLRVRMYTSTKLAELYKIEHAKAISKNDHKQVMNKVFPKIRH